jgi:hypothetical protein
MNALTQTGTMIFGIGIMLTVPAYFILQIFAPIQLQGSWRKAALAPLVLSLPLCLWCAYAFADQSNLWPLTMILFSPFGTFYLIILLSAGRKPKPAASS